MKDQTASARRDLYRGVAKPAFLAALLILLALTLLAPILTTLKASGPIIVNTTADPGSAGVCALRDAMTAANAEAAVNGCPAGTGTDTINFSVSGTITLVGSLPAIQNTLTIDGTTQAVTVDGANSFQVLAVNGGATLNVNALTIAQGSKFCLARWYGSLGGGRCVIYGNGGGIANYGTVMVTNSTFSGNAALDFIDDTAYGGTTAGGYGGGIYNQGTLTVTNSTFSGNGTEYVSAIGGGIYNQGTLTVTNSTFSGNIAGVGGGIGNGGTVMVTNSTFSGNPAEIGGCIGNGGTLTVTNSTFSGNGASSGLG
ncbi:MAG: hypothetical protein WA005_16490, partial [Candidatus Binataceae bacterium]